MTLHLIKLCVGIDDVDHLRASWQKDRLQEIKRVPGTTPRLFHSTRMTPRRKSQLLEGGSLYWVIKGFVSARQKLLDIEPYTDDEGIQRCRLILDPEVIETEMRRRRPFQGWRYLDPQAAPPDLTQIAGATEDFPPHLRAELRELGLL